jgi:hypothetical protein
LGRLFTVSYAHNPLILSVLLLFTGLSVCLLPAQAIAAPVLTVEKPERNLGRIESNKEIREKFILKNPGDEPLKITDVHSSCGCTSAYVDSRSINPGAETFVELLFDPKGMSGKQVARVVLTTNSSQTPSITLLVEADVIKRVEIIPEQAFFPQTPGDKPLTTSAQVISSDAEPFKILSVTSSADWLTASAEPVDAAKGQYKINLSAKSGMPQGMHSARVTIRTDAKLFPQVVLPVALPVSGLVNWAPAALELSLTDAGDPAGVTRHFVISLSPQAEAGKLVVVSAKVQDSAAKVQVIQPNDRSARIRVTGLVPSKALEGKFLVVQLQQPDQREIKIPIRLIAGR